MSPRERIPTEMTLPAATPPGLTAPAVTLPGLTPPAASLTEMSPLAARSLPAITLREMTWRDIPALATMELELFPEDAWSEQTWWAELAGRPRRSYAVGDQSGDVVGYAGLNCGGEVADVMTIAVAESAQGRSLGTMLMRWLIAQARRAGAEHLMLEVRADNTAAQRLYTAAGFSVLTVRRRYYQPGDVDALIMRLHLRAMSDSTQDREDSTDDRDDWTKDREGSTGDVTR